MKDILWTIYLIVAIWGTISFIRNSAYAIAQGRKQVPLIEAIDHISVAVLWAIWYMYYLH